MKKTTVFLSLLLCLLLSVFSSPLSCAEETDLTISGTIVGFEKSGHAILDIPVIEFETAGFSLGDIVTVTTENYSGDMPYFNGYYVEPGEAVLRSSSGKDYIAVCINYGNFSEAADAEAGDAITITLKVDDGALAQQEVNNLVYSNEREDYDLDRVFANFRPVVMGKITEGRLYRSASSVNNFYGRAAYANELAELVRVNAVMNLASTEEEILSDFAKEDFRSDYYRNLYESGRVIALGLPVNFMSPDFAAGIVRGLTFLSEQEPPYLIHCNEGKDRAGFAIMVLEALMGASAEEIYADYMLSYQNYYGIEPGTERYDLILENNGMKMLPIIAGTDHPEDVDLAAAAESYLTENGMDPKAIAVLKEKLSGS